MARRAAAVAVPLALLLGACGSGAPGDDAPTAVDEPAAGGAVDLAAAAEAAGCELSATGYDGPVDHLDAASAPPAAELYDRRPAVGGPHLAQWLEARVHDAPVEERAAVHNLEHGAVAVHLSPDLPADQADAVRTWARARNDAGLFDARTGAGVLVAPWEATLDPPVALRAWGVAADCPSFDASFADAFLLATFGQAGDAPEGSFGRDPAEVVDPPAAG